MLVELKGWVNKATYVCSFKSPVVGARAVGLMETPPPWHVTIYWSQGNFLILFFLFFFDLTTDHHCSSPFLVRTKRTVHFHLLSESRGFKAGLWCALTVGTGWQVGWKIFCSQVAKESPALSSHCSGPAISEPRWSSLFTQRSVISHLSVTENISLCFRKTFPCSVQWSLG